MYLGVLFLLDIFCSGVIVSQYHYEDIIELADQVNESGAWESGGGNTTLECNECNRTHDGGRSATPAAAVPGLVRPASQSQPGLHTVHLPARPADMSLPFQGFQANYSKNLKMITTLFLRTENRSEQR